MYGRLCSSKKNMMPSSNEIFEKLLSIENILIGIVSTWLTVKEAAVYARISESKMRKLIHTGKLPINRLDGKILINRKMLDLFIIYGTANPTKRQREAVVSIL